MEKTVQYDRIIKRPAVAQDRQAIASPNEALRAGTFEPNTRGMIDIRWILTDFVPPIRAIYRP